MVFEIPINDLEISEGDYIGEDGLLYCGKCHTPKQCYAPAISDKPVPCMCKCADEARKEERKREQEEAKQMEISRMRINAFPDHIMASWTFDHDDQKNQRLSQIARAYVDKFDEMKERGKGILLYGNVGTGKTFIAACIANALIDKGVPCMVTNFPRLINILQGKSVGRQDYIDNLEMFDLLVIDDLSSERDTEYMNEVVINVINGRYLQHKPLIVTTNLTGQDLIKPSDIRKERIYSRLFEMCIPVEVKGEDRRKRKYAEDKAEIRDLLGVKS